jgi:hypothetical protein
LPKLDTYCLLAIMVQWPGIRGIVMYFSDKDVAEFVR